MAGLWSTEQWFDQSGWFAQISFGWFALLFLAFWCGQELFNHDSSLRHNWRVFRALGDFLPIEYKKIYPDLGENHGGKQEAIEVSTVFRPKRHRHIKAIRITGRAFDIVDNQRAGNVKNEYHWYPVRDGHFIDRETINLVLAVIVSDFRHHGYYGDFQSGASWLGKNTVHHLIIEVFSGRRQQKKEFLIEIPQPVSGKLSMTNNHNPNIVGRFRVRDKDVNEWPEANI